MRARNQKHIGKIIFGEKKWEEFHTIYKNRDGEDRNPPYKIYYKKAIINNTITTFIHDKPANVTPFLITDNQKKKLGKLIYEEFF